MRDEFMATKANCGIATGFGKSVLSIDYVGIKEENYFRVKMQVQNPAGSGAWKMKTLIPFAF